MPQLQAVAVMLKDSNSFAVFRQIAAGGIVDVATSTHVPTLTLPNTAGGPWSSHVEKFVPNTIPVTSPALGASSGEVGVSGGGDGHGTGSHCGGVALASQYPQHPHGSFALALHGTGGGCSVSTTNSAARVAIHMFESRLDAGPVRLG